MRNEQNRFCTGRLPRLAVAVLIAWTTTVDSGFAQGTQPPADQQTPSQPAAKIYSLTDLEYLLGPVALYPDPLLTLILNASAFPLQIVQADRWLIDNADAANRGDFSQVDSMAWDSSVQALTRFPDVVQLLSDHLDWTESLGMAFSSQAEDVANVIQMLRAQAESKGNLKTTPEQVVTTREEGGSRTIYIAPANPERIYVPVYDSSVVFTDVLAGGLAFGAGVLVGSTWNNRWGWNDRRWNQVWVSPPAWHPPPPNWRPPQRPGARPPGIWRPDRPGSGRPDRPGAGRPDRPGLRPDRPGVGQPGRPGRPDRPEIGRPDRPGGGRPERPGANRPDRPAARPDRPSANRPANAQRPQNSQRRRQAGTQQRSRQQQTQRSSQRAGQQTRSRPQQRARPQQQRARPQQQRARPRQQQARPRQGGTRSQQRARPQRQRPATQAQ